jgi:hypothetical protein
MAKPLPITYGYATDGGLNPVRVAKGNRDYYGLGGPVRIADTG